MTKEALEFQPDALMDEQAAETAPGDNQDEATARPHDVPDAFWDAEQAQVKTDALLKSYLELESTMSAFQQKAPPPQPEDYQIDPKNDFVASDEELNSCLHEAGFSQDQAQLVYDLANERLAPMVSEIAAVFEAEHQVERLVQRFGGDDQWREAATQISAWGQANLPELTFAALATTYDGVLAIHQMMQSNEPSLVRDGTTSNGMLSESDLKQMMRDPRYWRDRDAAFVEKVRGGFKKLFPKS